MEHESPLSQQFWHAWQRVSHSVLRGLAGYHVTINGEMPTEPSLILAYPHGEHANSILLPPENLTYVAAADTWYKSTLFRAFAATFIRTVPISRNEVTREKLEHEIDLQRRELDNGRSIVVYVQGSRVGPAKSEEELRKSIKRGVSLMAKSHGVPVYPVGIQYPDGYNPQKGGMSAWKRLQKRVTGRELSALDINVNIGQPIAPPTEGGRAASQVFLDQLSKTVYSLAHPNR